MPVHVLPASPTAPTEASTTNNVTVPLPSPRDEGLHEALRIFMTHRPTLFKIAHRVLGSEGEAEDVVQEAWLRWQRTDRRVVDNAGAFLATATMRLALNVHQSARARRETSVTWLADRVDPTADLERTAERTEAIEQALHVLLEKLTPPEQAAYILRKGFDYPYRRVAAVLHLTPANARKLVSRADARIQSSRRQPVRPNTHRRLVRAFLTAAGNGEFGELEMLLSMGLARRAA